MPVNTAGEMYKAGLRDLEIDGKMVHPVVNQSSPSHGKGTIEIIGYAMGMDQSQNRIIHSTERPLNLGYCIGNFFYQMLGTKDVAPIEYYNPLAKKFSDDGTILHGTYGPRIVRQIRSVIELLKGDPNTRRAVVTVFDGRVDHDDSKDIPCPVSMQFLVRDDRLHCLAMFRSQNALMVFPYDIFLFTMIHEWIAAQVGIQVGIYTQYTGSHHIYDSEWSTMTLILQHEIQTYSMPPMTRINETDWFEVTKYESMIRRWGGGVGFKPLSPSKLDSYWTGICRWLELFAIGKRAEQHHMRDPSVLNLLWPDQHRS
jgi:thymidylate synthase